MMIKVSVQFIKTVNSTITFAAIHKDDKFIAVITEYINDGKWDFAMGESKCTS